MIPTLKTERLTLRAMKMTDAAAITAALQDRDVPFWLTAVPYPYEMSDAEAFITEFADSTDDPHWALDAGDGLIGLISIGSELGYWLRAEDHGRGYMTEAGRAVVAYHFDQTNDPLISGYHLGNAASCNVLTKLGFEMTHVEAHIKVATGQPVQTQRMLLVKDRWMNR